MVIKPRGEGLLRGEMGRRLLESRQTPGRLRNPFPGQRTCAISHLPTASATRKGCCRETNEPHSFHQVMSQLVPSLITLIKTQWPLRLAYTSEPPPTFHFTPSLPGATTWPIPVPTSWRTNPQAQPANLKNPSPTSLIY